MNKFLTALLVTGSAFGLGSTAQANSLDEPGSLLIFPYFSNARGSNTFLTVTNTNNNFNQTGQLFTGTVDVEFVYINGEDCLEFNRTRRLTPNDTLTVSTQDDNPNDPRGFVYVFAKSPTSGAAISWNYLEGDSIIASIDDVLLSNMPPVVYKAVPATDGAETDLPSGSGDGLRDMNGVEYQANRQVLHIPRFIATTGSALILLGLTGSEFTTVASYLAYNDNEVAFSGQITFDCWDYRPLAGISGVFTDSFLEMSGDNDLETGVTNKETGWIRIQGQTAFSSAQQRSNPAMLVARIDSGLFGGLPYGTGTNNNGDLVVIGPFYDTN